MTCLRCQDTLHVREGKGWVPCSCLRDSSALMATLTHGMSGADQNLDSLIGPEDVRRYLTALGVSCGERVVILGGQIEVRWQMATAIIATAGAHLRSVHTISLDRLVDLRFRAENANPPQTTVLWIQGDFPRRHAWNEATLNGILARRDRLTTVVTMETEWVMVKVPTTRVDAGLFRRKESA